MNLAIITPVWQRWDVTQLWADGVKDAIKNSPFPVRVVIVGSEGSTSFNFAKLNGFSYVEAPNQPLGQKFNVGFSQAKGSDYVMILGSDNILSPNYFEAVQPLLNKNPAAVGTTDSYQIQLVGKRAKYWQGYPKQNKRFGEPVGSGRIFSQGLLESVGYRLFPDTKNYSLDHYSLRKIATLGWVKWKIFTLKEKGVIHAGMKSYQDKNPYTATKGQKLHFRLFVQKSFSPEIAQKMIDFRPIKQPAKRNHKNPHL